MIAPGTSFGRYTIRERLGAGGMGDVYRATDMRLGRPVAIKVLPSRFAAVADRLDRFVREAKAASALNHPNIVTVHDVGEHDGTRFIVTELVDGVTFREWVTTARPPLEDLLDAVRQAALALEAAHRAGIVHRDVKPENLMRRRDGYVKVLDFGLAKLVATDGPATDAGAQVHTESGMVVGTVPYMSPEQASGDAVDERTDVWSLGVVLYELVAGRSPFLKATAAATLVEIVARDPEPLARVAHGAPDAVCRVVERALRKRRDDRFRTAAELADALDAARQLIALAGDVEASVHAASAVATVPMPAAVVTAPPPNNLNPHLATLVGRAEELDEVADLLRHDDARLVTLTGVGGTGKTCLALHAARRLLRDFEDGVTFVDLAPLADPTLVGAKIAETLGVAPAATQPVDDALAEHLRERRMLLVLDNFEHVVTGATIVSKLLAVAPRLVVLATSREPLHLAAERIVPIAPLPLPEPGAPATPDALARVASVALFVARAAAASPGFELTRENAEAVAAICRRLDGLPLAIELAAARSRVLAPKAMLARLERRLKLLTGGARDVPERQQTMRGAIAWSYDLLGEGERRLLERMAVFAGACALEAAESVCDPEGELDVASIDGIESLVDKNLLVRRVGVDGDPRFAMLEVVREYALERLEERGDTEVTARRHAGCLLERVEPLEDELVQGHASAVARVAEELDDVRAALKWSATNDPEMCLRLAGVVGQYWLLRGPYAEGMQWVRAAIDGADATPRLALARALNAASILGSYAGDLEGSRTDCERVLEVSRAAGLRDYEARARNNLGCDAMSRRDFETAEVHLRETLKICVELGDGRKRASALANLGILAAATGDLEAARSLTEQAVDLSRDLGNDVAMTVGLQNLGGFTLDLGDTEASRTYFGEGLRMAHRIGNLRGIAGTLDGMSQLAAADGNWTEAARLYGAVDALRAAAGLALESNNVDWRQAHVGRMREALGAAAFAAAEAAGRALSLDEAVAAGCSVAGTLSTEIEPLEPRRRERDPGDGGSP